MSNFTEEMIDNYADKLLIGLTEEERKMIQEEFDEIEKNMELIAQIPNISQTEMQTYPFDMFVDSLREDEEVGEEIPIDILFKNAGAVEGREIEVPKVVG